MKTKQGTSIRAIVATAVMLALLLAGVVYADVINIDSFDDGVQDLEANSGNQTVYAYIDTTAAIGGERDAWLQYSSGSGSVYLKIDVSGSNRFAYTSGDDVRGTARITWDGNDNDANSPNYNGLGDRDLTSNNTNDGFHIVVLSEDVKGQLVMTVYKYGSSPPGADWSSYSQYLAALNPGTREELFIPFSAFTTGGGTGADFAHVGAIVLELNNINTTYTEMSLDVSVDLIEASDTVREYGDLPVRVYGESILGAYHVPRGMRLGYNCDTETSYQSSTGADGDDSTTSPAVDDEDGVVINPDNWPWNAGSGGGHLDITVKGCGSGDDRCYVHGWIDWNGDGDFGDTVNGASEKIIGFVSSADGTLVDRTFTTPDPFPNGYYYARFRICRHGGNNGAACDSPTTADNNVTNGEVEDYRWALGPTAVIINSFTARPESGGIRLTWQTADETDLVSFDLLRSLAEGGPFLPLNEEAIQAQHPGRPEGATYSWLDGEVLGGLTYYYRLDIRDKDGQTTPLGPVSATAWYRLYLPVVLR